MHSNVGGGYPRSGMASVALRWMMLRAGENGLKFEDGAIQTAFDDCHVHGRMYNSRDGFAGFYRYHPREIEKLCAGRVEDEIRVHRSVLERSKHRTANYAPGQLPGSFEVVESDPAVAPVRMNPGQDPSWVKIRAEIDRWVLRRKGLYAAMLTFALAVVFGAGWLRFCPPNPPVVRKGFAGRLADILDYISPDFFDGLIDFAVAQHWYLFVGVVIVAVIYLLIRGWCRNKTVDACERLRHLVIKEAVENNEEGGGRD